MIPGFSVLYWISDRRKFASRFVHFAHETGIFCLGFRGPDCQRYNIAQFKENVFTVSLKRFVDCLKNGIQLRFVNVSNLVPKTLYERN